MVGILANRIFSCKFAIEKCLSRYGKVPMKIENGAASVPINFINKQINDYEIQE